MKKALSVALVTLVLIISSFTSAQAQTSVYPEIEKYFSSLSTSSEDNLNSQSMHKLKDLIETSEIDFHSYVYLLTSGNTDATAFANVIFQTWLYANKFKKSQVVSCSQSMSISEPALQVLKNAGYKIQTKDNNLFISFSEKARPIKLAVENCTDKKLMPDRDYKFELLPVGSASSTANTIYYSGSTNEEIFKSLARGLYATVSQAKK